MPLLLIAALLLAPALSAQSGDKEPFDVFALNRLSRVSDPQLSPDGSRVAFVVERILLSPNEKERHIWVTPTEGGDPRQLTFEGSSNTRPRWSPDSQRLGYVSDRSGSSQIWLMRADGGGARQLTDLATEASGLLFSPAGDRIVFASRVFPDCAGDHACNVRKLEEAKDSPVAARQYGRLLYRHWDAWDDGRRSHLFSLLIDDPAAEPAGLTPGAEDAPPFSLGGPDGYAISPDGAELCFERKTAERPELSTNVDLWAVPIEGGEPRRITSNLAADVSPVYSPDGRWIAYRSQTRPGYESDRFTLTLLERATGEVSTRAAGLDRSVTGITWSPDSSRLFFTAEDRGREPVYTVRVTGGSAQPVIYGDAHHGDVQLLPDGRSMIYTAHSGSRPADVYRGFAAGGQPQRLTAFNDALLARHDFSQFEEVTYDADDGTKISGFVVKPPGFNLDQRYPLLTLIHGGPQGAWGESWSYRWNAQVFASAGFVVFMPNPRGSTGYGQSFTDAIRADWGGKVYTDILSGVDYLLPRPYIDATRLAAAGASYGGYMVNWMLGNTSRFRAFVSHAGVYDLPSFFGATEELWFPMWEFHGPPWEQQDLYRRWSPSRRVSEFKTPTLVVHGEKDYRVPVTQGMQLFTALQMREVPSEFLYFPDEGHWILKPQNSVRWYESVTGWLKRWTE